MRSSNLSQCSMIWRSSSAAACEACFASIPLGPWPSQQIVDRFQKVVQFEGFAEGSICAGLYCRRYHLGGCRNGHDLNLGIPFLHAIASRPFMRGITMSQMTSSGSISSNRRRASSPSPASRTFSYPSFYITFRTSNRTILSSSTISILLIPPPHGVFLSFLAD